MDTIGLRTTRENKMKGFKDSSGKFHPITEHKGVRKSRDQKAKTKGVRMKRLTQLQVDEIKRNVLPLDKHAIMMMKFHQGLAKRDRFASPRWNSMTQAERLNALNRSGVHESAMGQKLQSREELSKLPYHKLPHYAKTDLAFNFFNLDREGTIRKARSFKPILDEDGDIDVDNEKNQQRLEEIIEEETARREEKLIENEDAYEELLNSGTDDVTAMGITVGAGTFLREHDPIAFRESLLADGTRPEIEQEVRDEIDEEDSLEGDRFLTLSILSPEQRFSQ